MRYRRADVTGGTYFFTVNLAGRTRTLLVDYVDTLREVVRMVKAAHSFHLDAMVSCPIIFTPFGRCQWAVATIRRGGC